jgi:N-acetylglucosamine-6-phosphate deacetylase
MWSRVESCSPESAIARTVQDVLAVAAGRVLTPTGFTGPATVSVDDDGRIVAVEQTSGPTDVQTLVPGFVDVQVNGIDDIDVASARGDDWLRLGDLLLDQGVTSWCPTLVTASLDRYAVPLARIAAAQLDDSRPTIIGAHLEGPFLGGAPGAHPRDLLAAIDLDWLAELPPVVRLVTLAPELAKAEQAIELLARRGIVVSIGHSTPTVEQVDAAVAAGATMATHLFNGMSGVHHREPGLALAALVDDSLGVGLIADLVHLHPLALQLAFRAKPPGRTILVTDAVAWRAGRVGAIGMTMRDGAPRLANGTLAGSAVTMERSIRNLVEFCGVSLEQAVRSASSNPARLMGCADRGEIVVGQRADLVALDADRRIEGVWLAGHRVR